MISQSCSRFCILPKSPRSIAFNPLRIQRSYFILLRRRLVVVSWPPGFAETIHLKHGKRRLLFEVHDSTMHKWHFIVFMKRYFFKYMIYNIRAYAQTLYNRYLHELHRNKLSVTCVKETSRECWRGATPFFALRRWYIHMLGCPVSFWTFSGVTFADFFFMFLFTQTWYLIQERWERSSGKDWKIPYCSIEGLCADTGVLGGSQRCSFVIQIFLGGDPIWIHFVGTLFDC